MSNSPFKFLSAYEKKDKDFFFGREKETDELYEMTYDTDLMLVVGASGTGKSSLIQCGLSNKIKDTRWNGIQIKRDKDINVTLENELDKELKRSGGIKFGETPSKLDKLENIYRATFKPIYLIFDQFEEIFTIKSSEKEQAQFFNTIKSIITTTTPCKVIIVMREEFTPQLWKYESIVPTLFDHKFRVERMRPDTIKKEVIPGTLDKLHTLNKLVVEDSKAIGEKVVESMIRSAAGLELTYLQVYLDKLYREAKAKLKENDDGIPVITPHTVDQLGGFDDILKDFLEEQLKALEKKEGFKKKEHIRILGEMVTEGKTKKALDKSQQHELAKKLKLSVEKLDECIQTFVNMRVIRQNDDGKIELAHDVLGPKIWELIPENDRLLRDIENSFRQRYNDFTKKSGSLLGVKEINSWKEYLPLLELNDNQKKFFEDSERDFDRKARNKRILMVVLGVLLIVSIVACIWALLSREQLKDNTIRGLYKDALLYSEERDYDKALNNLDLINEIDSDIDTIQDKLDDVLERQNIYQKYLPYQVKADSLIQIDSYKAAVDEYKVVFESDMYVEIMNDELKSELNILSIKLDTKISDEKDNEILNTRNPSRLAEIEKKLKEFRSLKQQVNSWLVQLN